MPRPDPSLLVGVVAPEVLDAMKVASATLTRAGVRHVVVGGLDVGRCRAYLATHAPSLAGELEDAVQRARTEEE